MATRSFKNLRRDDVIVLGLTLAASAGMIGAGAYWQGCQSVWLVNGLPAPVTVEIDGARTELAPDTRVSRLLRQGAHDVRVLGPTGAVLDEGAFDAPSGRFVAVSPLGAAPLLSVTVQYTASTSSRVEPEVTFFGGRRSAAQKDADYVFEDPPESLQVKSGERTSRVAIMLPKGGHHATMSYLRQHDKLPLAAEIARSVSRIVPGDTGLLEEAVYVTELAQGSEAALIFVREALARRPDDFDLHREQQYLMRRTGRLDEARAEYLARHERDPGSIDAALLLARLLPLAEAKPLLDGVLQAHPDSQLTALAAGWTAFAGGDNAGAVALFARGQGHPRYVRYMLDHLQALVALQRTPEAVALAARFLEAPGDERAPIALIYNVLARLPDAGPLPAPPLSYAEKLGAAPGGEGLVPLALSMIGESRPAALEKITSKDMVAAIGIQLAAGEDPTDAWKKCSEASNLALEQLVPGVAILLAAEFDRAGDHALAERLLWARTDLPVPRSAVLEYVRTGAEHPELWRLEPQWRAALDLVRGRALSASGASGAALFEAAERLDLLHGVVTRALRSWPPLVKPPEPKTKKGSKPKR
jgi:hypothetical protein